MAGSTVVRKSAKSGPDLTKIQITIRIGEADNLKSFYVNEDVLTRHSDFFAAAPKKEWKEATNRNVDLPEEDPKLINIFLSFATDGAIYSMKEGDNDNEAEDQEWIRLAECWLLGDRLQSSNFQDAVMDAITYKMWEETDKYPFNLYHIAYPNTACPNALRRLSVDIAAYKWTKATFQGPEVRPALERVHARSPPRHYKYDRSGAQQARAIREA